MYDKFPAVGHRYLVDFKQFRVELDFTSETSMTYYNLDANGNHVGHETVTIAVEPIRDGLFLVTWTEKDKTTVVHLEDYRLNRIITNFTDPKDGLMKFEGDMKQIA
jgi:MoaF-like